MPLDFFTLAAKTAARKAALSRGEYRTIIAGSRGLNGIGDQELVALAVARSGFHVTSVLSGTAKGIDRAGEKWAQQHGVPVVQYPANWDKEGKAAGYNRNLTMSLHADALVAVWDGESKGTTHMIRIMEDTGKPVFVLQVYRYWVSGTFRGKSAFTCLVVTDEEAEILWTCALLKRFIGQPFANLVEWGGDECLVEVI